MQNLADIAWTKTFNTVNDAITIHDNDFNIIKANKAAEKLLNLPLQTILSQKCYTSYHNTDSPPIYCPSCGSVKTGKPITAEIFEQNLNKNIEIKTLPILDKNKKFIGLVHIVRDYTEHRKIARKLAKTQEDLKQHAQELEDSNTALKVLLKQRDKDKKEFEENILSNLNTLIMPYIAKLKRNCPSSREHEYLNIIESNLKEIISPFSGKLSSESHKFTPREIRVSHLIKDGYQDKDIAEILAISVDTVKFHRKNIRKKLKLTNKKSNLKTSLLSQ